MKPIINLINKYERKIDNYSSDGVYAYMPFEEVVEDLKKLNKKVNAHIRKQNKNSKAWKRTK